MKKRVRKAIKKGASKVKAKSSQMMSAARKRLQMEVSALVKAGILSKSDAKKLLAEFIKELNTEKDKFLVFAKKELTGAAKRVQKKAVPVARQALANYRKVRARKFTAGKKTTKSSKKSRKTTKKRR